MGILILMIFCLPISAMAALPGGPVPLIRVAIYQWMIKFFSGQHTIRVIP
jgi:hypothetical protein